MKIQFASFVYAMLTFSVLLLSCKKEKDPSMFGKWRYNSYGTVNINASNTEYVETHKIEGNFYITFNENGDVLLTDFDGSTNTVSWKDERYPDHIVLEGVFKIAKLTDNEMILINDPEAYVEDFENDKSQPYNVPAMMLVKN